MIGLGIRSQAIAPNEYSVRPLCGHLDTNPVKITDSMFLFVNFLLVARLDTLGPLSGESSQIEVSPGVYSRERAAVSRTTPGRLLGVLLPRDGLVLRCELEPD